MSGVEMGLVQLALARPTEARRTLLRAMGDASESRLKVIQARATAALAEVSLVEGEAVEAEELAKEAISVAEAFSGRPVLWAAYGILGDAYGLLRRKEEATGAFSKASETLDWIRASVPPEHSSTFLQRPDVETLLKKTSREAEEGQTAGF